MKAFLPFAVLLLSTPLAAASQHHLPGVSDTETTIPSGGVTQYHRGHGDTLFVLGRDGRWYRVGLNDGCLSNTSNVATLVFDQAGGAGRIDRFTTVGIRETSGTFEIKCRIDSIRRSEAPPQVDSKSRVTLD